MKWILKKLIIVLIEALVVAGLLDALGIDLKGVLEDLKAEMEDTTEPSTEPGTTGTVDA